MVKLALFFIFFNTLSAQADDIGNLLSSIENAGQVNCEEMTFEELAEHCLREVCGPPGIKTSNLTGKNIDRFLTPQQQSELKQMESTVGKIFDNRHNEVKGVIAEAQKRNQGNKLQDTSKWTDEDYNNFTEVFWKYLSQEIDTSKPLKQRSSFTYPNTKNLDPVILAGIKEFAERFNKNVQDDPAFAFNAGLLDLNELKTAVKEKAQLFQKQLAEKKGKANFDFTKFKTQIDVNEDTEEIIKQYKQMDDIAFDSGIYLTDPDSYCGDKCKLGIRQFVKKMDMKTIFHNLNESLKYNDKQDAIAECKGNFVRVNQQNHSEDKFKQIWPKVKEGFYQNVIPKFSSHSQGLIKNYLENGVHFYFDNPTRETLPDLSEESNKVESAPAGQKSNASLLVNIIDRHFEADINLYSANISVCDSSKSAHQIWDSYLSKEANLGYSVYKPHYLDENKDNIAVSPFSCEHHGEGAGIVAHELGHAMSMVMRRPDMSESSLANYQQLRSCTNKNWDNAGTTSAPYFPGDHQFSEEDTADMISYMAINDGKTFYACGFVDSNETESSYANFEPFTYPDDSHSPSLIRLLRELEYKRTKDAPATCQAIMKKHNDKIGDKKCF